MISNDRFQFPPVEFRVHPFWFWNGEMEEEEIARQIEAGGADFDASTEALLKASGLG